MARILLAEDEKSLSKASAHILSKHGHEVVPVYDGITASGLLKEQSFDLVLLDVMMPGKSGIEVLKELRANDNDTRVIMLTAKSEIEDKLEGLENRADDYMTKPFDYRELLARIKVLLNRDGQCPFVFSDIQVDPKRRVIEHTQNRNASCSVTDNEVRLLKKVAQEQTLPIDAVSTLLSGDRNKTILYISYINNKLERLSSHVRLIRHEDILCAEVSG